MQAPRTRQRIGLAIAAAVGWNVDVPQPPPDRCVIIGAPHTSNWELPLTVLVLLAADLEVRWVAKDTLFRGPLGVLLRALGGMPVNRRSSTNFVDRMIDAFQASHMLRLGIIPEGTRRKTLYWKTGFYYIALGAGVPIVMAYADYPRKRAGLGPTLHPTGDIQADFAVIRAFYADITGKYPEQQGPIQTRPQAANAPEQGAGDELDGSTADIHL
jgi:1-acyl-sn-glycerol-3-phosphate acyltransferase